MTLEVAFADRMKWFDAVISGSFRGSEVRLAWGIVRSLDERTNAAIFTQADMARELRLAKETVEEAVRTLRNRGYVGTDSAGPGQANGHRLLWPDTYIAAGDRQDRISNEGGQLP